MASEYTPNTASVRESIVHLAKYHAERQHCDADLVVVESEVQGQFDRWLAEVERSAAVKAIEDASDEIELGDWSHHGNLSDRSNAEAEASTWLDKRAISLSARAAALGLTAGQEGENDA